MKPVWNSQAKIVAYLVPENRSYQGVRSIYKNYEPITFFHCFSMEHYQGLVVEQILKLQCGAFLSKRCLYYYYFLWGETPAWNSIPLRKLLCGVYKTPNGFDDCCCFSLFLPFQKILSEHRLSIPQKNVRKHTRVDKISGHLESLPTDTWGIILSLNQVARESVPKESLLAFYFLFPTFQWQMFPTPFFSKCDPWDQVSEGKLLWDKHVE